MEDSVAVAKSSEVPAGKSVRVTCHGEDVAVFNVDGEFFACSNRCPHAGAPLNDGFMEGTVVVCPWHGWRFDLAAGPDAPKDGVLRYPVTIEGDDILIGPALNG